MLSGFNVDPAHPLLGCGVMDAVSAHCQLKTAISVKSALTMTCAPPATATATTSTLSMTPGIMNLMDMESGVTDVASALSRPKIATSAKIVQTMTCAHHATAIGTPFTLSTTVGNMSKGCGAMDVASARSRLKVVTSVKYALTMTCVHHATTIDTSSTRSMTAGSMIKRKLLPLTRQKLEFTFGLLVMDAVKDPSLASATSAMSVLIMTCVARATNRGTCCTLTMTLGRACLQLLPPLSS